MKYFQWFVGCCFCLISTVSEAAIDTSVGRSDVTAYSGSFNTSIAIPVAPGRAGLQPALSLKYTSGRGNSLYGLGWNLEIARIERSTKDGKPAYTDNDTFVLIMNGAANTLVQQSNGEFRVRNESAFLHLQKQGNFWIVQDKNDTKYYFGNDSVSASQNSAWPMQEAQAFSWSLSRVDDINGNTMRYFYSNDNQGQRIDHIDYALGNTVQFTYETRLDIIQSYRSGFLQRTANRLKTIKSYAGNTLSSFIELAYTQDAQSLLTQVITHDPENRLKNRIESFTYSNLETNRFTGKWQPTKILKQNVTFPLGNLTIGEATRDNHYIDMNGDGVAELVYLNDTGSITIGYGRIPDTDWPVPESGLKISTPVDTSYYPRALVDMNSDGLPDWAVKNTSDTWHIYLNKGTEFETTPQIWNDASSTGSGDYLLDTNGDGLPDLISFSGGVYQAWINLGESFSSTPSATTIVNPPYTLNLIVKETNVKPTGVVLNLFTSIPFPPEGKMIPALTPTLWKKQSLMTSKTNHQSGLKQQISYKLQTNIVNAPDLKLWAVNRTSTSGPVAAEYRSIKYAYAGGLYNISTKEFRGFKTVTQTDEQTNLSTVTDFYQDIIFQGRPFRIRTMLTNSQQLISDTKTTWLSKQYDAGKRHFAYVSANISDSYELDGSLVSQNKTDNIYDSSGNITQSISSIAGYRTMITNQFTAVNSCVLPATTLNMALSVCRTISKLTQSTASFILVFTL